MIEAAEIGFGGAGRDVGLVNAGTWLMPDDLIRTRGNYYGKRLLDVLGAGPAYVWEMMHRHGIDCEGKLVGTLYARGLTWAALRVGAVIHSASPATAITRDGSGWRITTQCDSLRAGRVVRVMDACTRFEMHDIARKQIALPCLNMATRSLPPDVTRQILPGRRGVRDTREVLHSCRFDAQNRLVFGSVGALRDSGTAVHRAWAKRMLRRISPQIGLVKFESEWFGAFGMTPYNLPRFQWLEEGIFAFRGFNEVASRRAPSLVARSLPF